MNMTGRLRFIISNMHIFSENLENQASTLDFSGDRYPPPHHHTHTYSSTTSVK
jgi:hypothetical protein